MHLAANRRPCGIRQSWQWGRQGRLRRGSCRASTLAAAGCAVCLQESQVLARAVKDHERRVGTKEGFGGEPGDCLAYKYYRDVSVGAL